MNPAESRRGTVDLARRLTTTLAWGDPLLGFADVWLPGRPGEPATASLHLSPETMTNRRLATAVDEVQQVAPRVSVSASLPQTEIVDALTARGFRQAGGPWFAQFWRRLADLSDLRPHRVPGGYVVRHVRPDELTERVEVHRRCWDPVRIKQMLHLPVTGDEAGSRYTIDGHLTVVGTPIYRAELDLVVEAPDGSLAAYGLGWLDPESRSVLFEPVGTVPAHTGRGLARALCTEMLRVARRLGAVQAVVAPRGDAAYPVPRRLYEGLGMGEVARSVPFSNA